MGLIQFYIYFNFTVINRLDKNRENKQKLLQLK